MSMLSESAIEVPALADQPRPVSVSERMASIDVLRGFALCGILVMNIPWFARSESMFFNPTLGGGFEGADYWTWLISHLFFDMKMMTIFSMLFGAGMLILTERARSTGRSAAAIYYRRLWLLLVFGLLHAYLLWSGDILYSYALCGLILYPARNFQPRTLILIGAALLLIGSLITSSSGFFFDFARSTAREAAAIVEAGGTPNEMQQGMVEAWQGIEVGFLPGPEELAAEKAAFLGSYWELFKHRAGLALLMQTMLFVLMLFWRAAGLMFIGMALMKMRVFTGERSLRFYLMLMIAGYLIGLPIVGVGVSLGEKTQFDFVAMFKYVWTFNYVGSIAVALGHVGLVMLIVKLGLVQWLTAGLSAIGRMALTNYLMHSVICATIFFGWGFGSWGQWSRFETMGVVAAILLFQFIVSPLWLSMFRFGPMEWLWRSLTYWRVQPMLKAP